MDRIEGVSIKHIKLLFNDEKYLDKYLDRIFFEVYERPCYQNNIDEINKKLEELKLTEKDLVSNISSSIEKLTI
jgi:hypothetical protein